AFDDPNVSEFRKGGEKEAVVIFRAREGWAVDQPANRRGCGRPAVVDHKIIDGNASGKTDRVLVIAVSHPVVKNGDDAVAGRAECAAADANASVPFRAVVAPEVYEMVSVARGVFDKQIAAAGNRDAADADLAVADVEIPAVEVDIDAIEPAVFETEVLVE